jgi:hypothetical protein
MPRSCTTSLSKITRIFSNGRRAQLPSHPRAGLICLVFAYLSVEASANERNDFKTQTTTSREANRNYLLSVVSLLSDNIFEYNKKCLFSRWIFKFWKFVIDCESSELRFFDILSLQFIFATYCQYRPMYPGRIQRGVLGLYNPPGSVQCPSTPPA